MGDARDDQAVVERLSGARQIALGVAARDDGLRADPHRGEKPTDRPEQRHAQAGRRLRRGGDRSFEVPDHQRVEVVHEELGDHREHHPGPDPQDSAHQGKLEMELQHLGRAVVEIGQRDRQKPPLRSTRTLYRSRVGPTSSARRAENARTRSINQRPLAPPITPRPGALLAPCALPLRPCRCTRADTRGTTHESRLWRPRRS